MDTGQAPSPGAAGRPAGQRALALLMACHPGPTAAVTVLMTALAAFAGQSAGRTVLAAAAVLTGQLSVGWSNDAVDANRDTAARRPGKPVASGAVGAGTVAAAAAVALAGCTVLSLAYGALAGAVHLAGVGAAWAYNLGLKATPLSWLPYAAGFASLPAFVALGLPGRPWPAWWIVSAAALLGIGAHLADVLPDIEADLAAGVRGWPQRLGRERTRLLLPVPLVAASGLLALARPGPVGVVEGAALAVAVVLAVGGALTGRGREKVPFLAAVGVAVVDVALLLWAGAEIA